LRSLGSKRGEEEAINFYSYFGAASQVFDLRGWLERELDGGRIVLGWAIMVEHASGVLANVKSVEKKHLSGRRCAKEQRMI
jgi:hypothetical protein